MSTEMFREAQAYHPLLFFLSDLTPNPLGAQPPFSILLNKPETETAISTPQQLCWQPWCSPGKPPAPTWKTGSRRLLPRVILSTSAVWQLLAQGVNPSRVIYRYLLAVAVLGSHSKAAALYGPPAFASPKKTSIPYRKGAKPLFVMPS